ncbi:hypothetical protein [Marinicrinis lubricantis]|uniref:Uncharacterized protein n=1 Tax=Marinicrinis lubricantis TaxID=2086470 RepID=A0ABW1IKJ5_9BACL
MEPVKRKIPAAAVRATASGVIFMALFGSIWAYTGTMGLQGWNTPWLLVAAAVIGLALIAGAIALIRASKALQHDLPQQAAGYRKRILFWFNVIFAAEGLAIAATVMACIAAERTDWIPIFIAIIVGIHFFPLASLFRVDIYHYTGALLCVLALITWLAVPAELKIGDQEIMAYMTFVGFGSALILWATALVIWNVGRRLLRDGRKQQ